MLSQYFMITLGEKKKKINASCVMDSTLKRMVKSLPKIKSCLYIFKVVESNSKTVHSRCNLDKTKENQVMFIYFLSGRVKF